MAELEEVPKDYKEAAEWYTVHWEPGFKRWWKGYETLGLHAAFYEKGVKSFEEALLNMNDFVGRLLEIDPDKQVEILDAGCGVGGTSIYLGNKYPNARFTGITITPLQVELAKKFAKERNKNNNTRFLLRSYLDTGFPDESFDGAFALESIDYAKDKRAFVKEMYRILKPNGKLVVVGPFITKSDMNDIMRRIYHWYYLGRGKPEFPVLQDFKRYLLEEGFRDIKILDISKNIAKSQARSFMLSLFFIPPVIIKRIFLGKKYDPSKDIDYYLAVAFLAPIMGLSKTAGYFAVTARKGSKED